MKAKGTPESVPIAEMEFLSIKWSYSLEPEAILTQLTLVIPDEAITKVTELCGLGIDRLAELEYIDDAVGR